MNAPPTEPAPLLSWNDAVFGLGVDQMDATHRAFVDLLNRLDSAPTSGFPALFAELAAHTRAHFEDEEARMRECAFPALVEHRDEHRRVLGDLARFGVQVDRGRTTLARAWVRETLPDWFRLHATTMDSALAAHWKRHQSG